MYRSCGHLALPKFRREARTMTPCVLEPEHEGNHVYCVKGTHSLNYYEEIKRTELKPVLHVDIKSPFTDEECSMVYQYLEAANA